MPVYTHQLGNEAFVTLDGEVRVPSEQLEIVDRPGVDGLGFWRTGVRGMPFELVSGVDVQHLGAGQQKRLAYAALIGSNPLSLVQYDVHWDQVELRFVVLDVETQIREIAALVGGFSQASRAWVRARWTLIAVVMGG